MRAAIYTRQSKDVLGTEKAVTRQLEDCERLAAARGWTITHRLSDNDLSASNGKPRPDFIHLMKLISDGAIDVIVVWAVDRLVRRLADLETVIDACEAAGVKLATVSGDLDLSTDQGRLVGRILASVARGEVERKSARQKRANLQAAQDGKPRMGGARPFGWQADRKTADPNEAQAIADACRALLAGGTVTGIAREWQTRGLPRTHGAPAWTRVSVRGVLSNPRIAGLAVHQGQIVGRGEWDSLVTPDTFEAVRRVLEGRAPQHQKGRTLLGGLALCPCGARLVAMQSGSKGRHRVYRCRPHQRDGRPGPHVAVNAAPVDGFIAELVIARLSQADAASLIAPARKADIAALQDEAQAIRVSLREMAADRVLGLVTREQLLTATARGNARRDEIAGELAEAGRESVLAPLVLAGNVREAWGRLDIARRRAVIDTLMSITLLSPGRGAREFSPRTVRVEPKS